MARVIPSGTTDYTTQIAMREAAANDALTRLFYTMIMRREDRERMEALRREMQQNQQDFTRERDETFRQQRLDEYELLRQDREKQQQQQQRPSKLRGTGTGQPSAPAAPAAPTQAPRDPTQFNAPGSVGPNPNKFSTLPNNIYAQADDEDVSDGGTVELSAQRQQQRRGSVLPRPRATMQTPRQSRSKKGQSVFADDTPPEIATAWEASERKYGLARGTLQALMGLYNDGGADDGTDDDGTDRLGWFKFSKELRTLHGISDTDALDPVKMGDHAARNLKRNVDATNKLIRQYNRTNGTDFPQVSTTNSRDVPALALLSQLGVHDGPTAILQHLVNPKAPLADALGTGPDGKPRDGGRALINLGFSADATTEDVYKQTGKDVAPYFEETVRSQDQSKPVGPRTQNAVPRPPANVGGGDDIVNYLISRGVKPDRVMKLNDDLKGRIAYVMQKAEEATGSRISVSSSYRSPQEQAQIRANSRGVPVTYNGVRYLPQPGPRGFMAAPPGQSQHNQGKAFDFNRSPARDWLHGKEGQQVLRDVGLRTLRGDAPHIELVRGTLPAFTYPQTQTADATPQPQQSAPQAPPPAPAPAVVKPSMVSGMTGGLPTFGTPVSAPLATMPDAVAGIKMGVPDQQFVGPTQDQGGPAPQPATATTSPAPAPQAPDESSAAANQPTPQVAGPNQTAPAGPADSLMPDSTAMPPLGDMFQAAPGQDQPVDVKPSTMPSIPTRIDVGTLLSTPTEGTMPGLSVDDFRTGPAPEFQSATDNPFEAELGPQPGEYSGKVLDTAADAVYDTANAADRGVNNVIQGIMRRASEYNKLAASRNESKQLEQMYDYSQQPDAGITIPDWMKPDIFNPPMEPTIPRAADKYTGAPPTPRVGDERYTPPVSPITLPDMPQVDTGYLRPDRMYEEQDAALERRLANPPPHTGIDLSLPSRDVAPAVDLGAGRQADYQVRQHMAPRDVEPPSTTYTGDYTPPDPQQQPTKLGAPTPPTQPVVAPTPADITGAIFGGDQVQGSGLSMDWISNLAKRVFGGKGDAGANAAYQREDQLTKPLVRPVVPIAPPVPPDPLAIPKRALPPIVPPKPTRAGSTSLPPEVLKGTAAGANIPKRSDYKPGTKRRDEKTGKVIDTKTEKKQEDDDE